MKSPTSRHLAPLWLTCALLLWGAAPAPAAPVDPQSLAAALAACGCAAERPELEALAVRIASADDVDEARHLALAETRRARSALRRAQWFAPGSDSIRAAGDRLDAYELRVMAAATPEDVSQRYASLMHNDGVDIDVDPPNCHYGTGEIIAIVLGLFLGIIPGLILLVLLC